MGRDPGDEVIYTCPVGEQFPEGGTTRTIVCLPQGVWSARVSPCKREFSLSLVTGAVKLKALWFRTYSVQSNLNNLKMKRARPVRFIPPNSKVASAAYLWRHEFSSCLTSFLQAWLVWSIIHVPFVVEQGTYFELNSLIKRVWSIWSQNIVKFHLIE